MGVIRHAFVLTDTQIQSEPSGGCQQLFGGKHQIGAWIFWQDHTPKKHLTARATISRINA
eukprot:2263721-Amphidinium_carterae.1